MEWASVPHGRIRQEPDGVFHLVLDDDTRLDEAAAKELASALHDQLRGDGFLLADITGLAWIEREARTVIADGTYAKARAILVRSATAQVLAQLFQALHNPAIPTRTFNSESEARDWLSTLD